jgi:hypothetical protein
MATCLSRDARQGEKAMVAAEAAVAVVLQLSRADVLGSCWCVFEELAGLDGKQRFVAGWTGSAKVDTLLQRDKQVLPDVFAQHDTGSTQAHIMHEGVRQTQHRAAPAGSECAHNTHSTPTRATSSQTHTHTWAHARRATCGRSMWKQVTRQRKTNAPESGHRHASHGCWSPKNTMSSESVLIKPSKVLFCSLCALHTCEGEVGIFVCLCAHRGHPLSHQ